MVDHSYSGPPGKRLTREEFQRRHGIIGHSIEMREVVETVMQVAGTDITVLISGESGTGKEVIANAIHEASKRRSRKFVAVNCGAIPEGILESELFGHEKGAFTGAHETRKGYFELADGGTIFLDEIGEMPVSTQVKLLRVLENGEFMRVGSSQTQSVDVRLVAASNKELEKEVQAKRFRQDLYYRLRSVTIRIPPLRQRKSDISLLAEHFLLDIVHNDPGNNVRFTDDAIAAMIQHAWPGNVRELKHAIESIAVLEYDKAVDGDTIRKYLKADAIPEEEEDRFLPVRMGRTSEQAERELILRALFEIRNEILDLRQVIEEMNGNPGKYAYDYNGEAYNGGTYNNGDAYNNGETYSGDGAVPMQDDDHRETDMLDRHSLLGMEKTMIRRALERFEGSRREAANHLNISERTLYRKIRDYGIE